MEPALNEKSQKTIGNKHFSHKQCELEWEVKDTGNKKCHLLPSKAIARGEKSARKEGVSRAWRHRRCIHGVLYQVAFHSYRSRIQELYN